ncbi:MAG: DUF881 domain-containing protein [Bifidobacteriaceae bacterium]|jgi:uncharacterized protein YlxW (UPF0749 family)|nr:DUF881 domain-containing protein [Bifidobacteriaceae bacterium]
MPRQRRLKGTPTSHLLVGLVALLAGLMFAVNASQTRHTDLRDAPGLLGLVTEQDRAVQALEARQIELTDELEGLMADVAPAAETGTDAAVALASGARAVHGPGLVVTLSDAAPSEAAADVPLASLLVHQQDIDAVLNALWAGGAEAVAVQGHRVVSTTAIRCVGNVILVGGRVYSPPYTISAIGPAGAMEAALEADPGVQAYLTVAQTLGLGWSLDRQDDISVEANPGGGLKLEYARAAERLGGEEGVSAS